MALYSQLEGKLETYSAFVVYIGKHYDLVRVKAIRKPDLFLYFRLPLYLIKHRNCLRCLLINFSLIVTRPILDRCGG